MNEHYDVIIIGSGAGGGTLAHRLAPSGKRILILERGDYLRREPDNWDSNAFFVRNKYKSGETWFDKDGQPFHPGQHYYVGGQTKFYGAILFRLRERDFGEVTHHGGISPAWPISYDDLAPYYDEAERLYLVHGERGEDPSEPPASGPFPYPAVSHEPRIQKLHDDLVRAGRRPFHLPPRRAHPDRGRRTSMRHRAVRDRPGHLGARCQLQGARPRQPVRRRHELLPVLERGEPGADGDGERAPHRRPPDGAARRDERRRAAGGDGVMKLATLANGIGKGVLASAAGTAAMT